MILSLLEYTALRVGIVPRPQLLGVPEGTAPGTSTSTTTSVGGDAGGGGGLLWSGLVDDDSTATNFSQRLGDNVFAQTLGDGRFAGSVQQVTSQASPYRQPATRRLIFECSAGVRVVTTVGGAVIAIVGVDDVPHQGVRCTIYSARGDGGSRGDGGIGVSVASVKPNEVWSWPRGFGAPAELQRSSKFVRPHP